MIGQGRLDRLLNRWKITISFLGIGCRTSDPAEDRQLWSSLRDSVLNRIFVSKEANNQAKAQVPPNYLDQLTADERRLLQIPESFLGPLAAPIRADAFTAYLRDRYDLIKQDFVDHVRRAITGRASPS